MNGDYRVGPEDDPDRYALGTAVASGAEGILYRGTITTSGGLVLDVAIKVLQPRWGGQVGAWHARWSEQLELLRSLHVPGVVPVRDGFLGVLPHPARQAPPSGRNLYLVMNWVEGQALDEWVSSRPERDVIASLKLLIAAGAALDVMHSGQMTGGVPVVHRDVKPANILITAEGAVLVDFGMTRGLPTVSRLSGVTGTPGYIAPESLASGVYGPASDRYALGCVAYFVITGSEPPHDPDPAAMRARLATVPALSGRTEVVDRVMSMLAVDPADRPVHAANWLAGVRGSSLSEIPPGKPETAPVAPAGLGVVAGRDNHPAAAAAGRRALLPVSAVVAVVLAVVALWALPPDGGELTAATIGRSTDTTATTASAPGTTAASATTAPSERAAPGPAPSTTSRPGPTSSTSPLAPTTTVRNDPPPTSTTTAAPNSRATPAITASNESYEVEVIGQYQVHSAEDLTGFIRRRDLQRVTGEGPDGYGSVFSAGWRGLTFGSRCLTSGGSSGNLSVPGEPLHLYAYGVVGLEATKVELVWDTGRRVEATLGQQTFSVPVRWWIAAYDTGDPDEIVATDAAGGSWTISSPLGVFGQVGC